MSEEHVVRMRWDPYVDYDPCGKCGSNEFTCECGWTGCLSGDDVESEFHGEVYRDQPEED